MAKAGLRERFIRPWLSLRGVALVSLAAIAVLCAACLLVLFQSRLELVRRADIMAGNILLLADQTVEIEIRRYDLRLLDVISDLHDAAATPGGNGISFGEALFGGLALRNSTGDIIVVDARGRVLGSSRPDVTPHYAADLPSIMSHAGMSGMGPRSDGLSLSTVLPDVHGQPLIALTRWCLPHQCGQAAAVVAVLPMAWIQSVFDGLILGRNGAIALTDGSGTLLARQPALPGSLGQRTEPQSVIARIPRIGSKIYRRGPVADDRCCRVTAAWIDNLPLLVFVSISRAEILSGWSDLAIVIVVAVVLLSSGLAALTLLLGRAVHRKMEVDRELLAANAQLAELARTDGLTGLLNRRGLDETLAREWRRCLRNGKPIGLLMLDADHFKAYNDRYGHQAGDGVLRAVGVCITSTIRRPGDIAARYGGEEFAVILPDTDLAGAAAIAEAIRSGVETLAMPHAEANAVVTLSIGVGVSSPGSAATAEGLLAAADAALYESKATGRNRVTIRPATPQPVAEPVRA